MVSELVLIRLMATITTVDESSFVDKVNLFYNKKPASVEDGGREI